MRSRDEEVRATISKDEAIRLIREKYHAEYDSNCGLDGCFDAWDQLLACESVAEATPVRSYSSTETEDNKESAFVYKSGNDTYKRKVNFELTTDKLEAIAKLRECNYKTPPPKVASLLAVIFEGCGTEPGWLLAIAQLWNPRTINRVLVLLTKLHSGGWKTINNPAAYFSSLIKHRKKRRSLPVSMIPVNNSKNSSEVNYA